MDNGFQSKEGQQVPEMTKDYCNEVSERYIELYEIITGDKFVKTDTVNLAKSIEENLLAYLKK